MRGRAGYAFNNVLVYATGGFAYGGGSVSLPARSRIPQTHTGWTRRRRRRGRPHAELDGESRVFCYVRLDDQSYVLTGLNNGFQSNIFRLGVNYRF